MAWTRPLDDIEITEVVKERFFAKTKRSETKFLVDENTKEKVYCLEWTGAPKDASWSGEKYGVVQYGVLGAVTRDGEKRTVSAHRMAYYIEYGIDPGVSTDHLCHNTLCVEPRHLYGGSIAENNRNRRPCLSKYCKHGHEFTEENTYITLKGHRDCRECHRIADAKRYPARYEAEKALATNDSTMRDFAKDPILTWDDVREIRRIYYNGEMAQRPLARKFKVSQPMIGFIVRGESWREPNMLIMPQFRLKGTTD